MASLIAVNELPPYVLYLYGEKDYKELKRLHLIIIHARRKNHMSK